MSDYNGWTNYATWRVNLEVFDGRTPEDFPEPEDLQYYMEELIDSQCQDGIAKDYALAFIEDVNWSEIHEFIHAE